MHKLPALQAISHALKAVIQFRKAGTRIGLPWVLVLTVISFFGNSFSIAPGPPDDAMNSMTPGPMDFVVAALSLIIFSSIAVNWHRYILLDEATKPEKIFRLDRPVWHYAIRTLLIMFFALIPVFILLKLFAAGLPGLNPVLVIAVSFVAGIYVMRASLALPAIALERKDFGIGPALQATKGNNLQFAALLTLNTLIVIATFLVIIIIVAIVAKFSTTAARVLAVVLSIPAKLFLSLFSVSLLSSLYGFFVEKRKF